MNQYYANNKADNFFMTLIIDEYKDDKGRDAEVQANYMMKVEFNDQLPKSPSNPPISFKLNQSPKTVTSIG